MMLADDSGTKSENAGLSEETAREDVAGTNEPTAEEENEGMSTILDPNPVTGVQTDASDE